MGGEVMLRRSSSGEVQGHDALDADVGQALLMQLCVSEWRNVAAAASLSSLKSRVDEVNSERRRLEKVVAIMRKVPCPCCVVVASCF